MSILQAEIVKQLYFEGSRDRSLFTNSAWTLSNSDIEYTKSFLFCYYFALEGEPLRKFTPLSYLDALELARALQNELQLLLGGTTLQLNEMCLQNGDTRHDPDRCSFADSMTEFLRPFTQVLMYQFVVEGLKLFASSDQALAQSDAVTRTIRNVENLSENAMLALFGQIALEKTIYTGILRASFNVCKDWARLDGSPANCFARFKRDFREVATSIALTQSNMSGGLLAPRKSSRV